VIRGVKVAKPISSTWPTRSEDGGCEVISNSQLAATPVGFEPLQVPTCSAATIDPTNGQQRGAGSMSFATRARPSITERSGCPQMTSGFTQPGRCHSA
jgi:hypothetical protein